MARVYAGGLMIVAGIAAFIEAHAHVPEYGDNSEGIPTGPSLSHELLRGHLSRTQYDLLLIVASALVILGVLTVVMALIRYWRAPVQ
ncbi:MAG TPA: hypothetical protein VKG38_04205 [Solirubrobacteraceae bacterium]|nr:hypothetical protein [Solirubrobacteraceae bacterium]